MSSISLSFFSFQLEFVLFYCLFSHLNIFHGMNSTSLSLFLSLFFEIVTIKSIANISDSFPIFWNIKWELKFVQWVHRCQQFKKTLHQWCDGFFHDCVGKILKSTHPSPRKAEIMNDIKEIHFTHVNVPNIKHAQISHTDLVTSICHKH